MAAPITRPRCSTCDGAGHADDDERTACDACHGSGVDLTPLRAALDDGVAMGAISREDADRGVERLVERNARSLPGARINVEGNPAPMTNVQIVYGGQRGVGGMGPDWAGPNQRRRAVLEYAVELAVEGLVTDAALDVAMQGARFGVSSSPMRLAQSVVGSITVRLDEARAQVVAGHLASLPTTQSLSISGLPSLSIETLRAMPEGERVAVLRKLGGMLREVAPEAADVLEGFGS